MTSTLGVAPRLQVRRQNYPGGAQAPQVPVQPAGRAALSEGMATTLRETRARSYGEDAPVFATRIGTPLNPSNVRRRVLDPATVPLGLGWVGFHTSGTPASRSCSPAARTSSRYRNGSDIRIRASHCAPASPDRRRLGSADFLDRAVESGKPAPHPEDALAV